MLSSTSSEGLLLVDRYPWMLYSRLSVLSENCSKTSWCTPLKMRICFESHGNAKGPGEQAGRLPSLQLTFRSQEAPAERHLLLCAKSHDHSCHRRRLDSGTCCTKHSMGKSSSLAPFFRNWPAVFTNAASRNSTFEWPFSPRCLKVVWKNGVTKANAPAYD